MLEQSDERGFSAETSADRRFERFAGVKRPMVVAVNDPEQAKNKGSGKRLKGGKETAMIEQKRGSRLCSVCQKYEPHNSRTCPMRNK